MKRVTEQSDTDCAAIGFNAAMRNLAILVLSLSFSLSFSPFLSLSCPFSFIVMTRFLLTSSVLGRGESVWS